MVSMNSSIGTAISVFVLSVPRAPERHRHARHGLLVGAFEHGGEVVLTE